LFVSRATKGNTLSEDFQISPARPSDWSRTEMNKYKEEEEQEEEEEEDDDDDDDFQNGDNSTLKGGPRNFSFSLTNINLHYI
jgi:hypothetical protein